MNRLVSSLLFSILIGSSALSQEIPVINVNTLKPVAPIQPTMWGVFFEDINFAADGGIYAELVKNRSFEFLDPWMGWDIKTKNNHDGDMSIINKGSSNPRFARIKINTDTAAYSLVNEGFRGIGIKAGENYFFTIMASLQTDQAQIIKIDLLDSVTVIATTQIQIDKKGWNKYSSSLRSTTTVPKAQLRLSFVRKAITDIDMVSLFPENTWKKRPGGLRNDLVQLLADMKPGFVRFPGGCIVEGRDLNNRYQWKKTVGDINNRELIINRWNTEFAHRSTPDYFQSFGLGFYEYFLLSEDLGAEPLPIINCGMACQFNTSELVTLDQLDPYIQDALDLIEFANGSVDSKWGKLRASMGHSSPFNLKMLGVGNEQWGPQYMERYEAFAKVLKSKHPEIKLVSSVGPFAGGELFNYLNPLLREMNADLLDEHYYMSPDFFQKNAKRYDNYDRSSSKIFAGEYAAHVRDTEGQGRSIWLAALSEAAFMTGLERNGEVVNMCSYAPLFAHVDAWQWAPNLIWFDNLRSYGTASYQVQKLFSLNKGTEVLSATMKGLPIAGEDSLYVSAVKDQNTKEVIVKVVNTSSSDKQSKLNFSGKTKGTYTATINWIESELKATNSLDKAQLISPQAKQMVVKLGSTLVNFPPHSVSVIKIKI